MTWTYSLTDLATSAKDQVRLLIGDTYTGDQQLQDEEINQLLTTRSTVYGAAAECCRSLASKFSRSVDLAAAVGKASYSQMAKAYLAMATKYEAAAAAGGAALPYAGGISVSDKQQQEQNSDRVSPQFNIGMDDDMLPVGPVGNETSTLDPSGPE